ncbi:MAG: hypothetical protein R3C53_05530 [Pirellulaceae bacterium]
MYHLRTSLLLVGLVGLPAPADGQNVEQPSRVQELIDPPAAMAATIGKLIVARRAVSEQLKSARATGTLLRQVERNLQSRTVVQDVEIYFREPMYRIHLSPQREADEQIDPALAAESHGGPAHAPNAESREPLGVTVLFDGKLLTTISAFQASGQVHFEGALYFEFKQQTVLRNAGYPFAPPLHLWNPVFDPEKLDPKRCEVRPLGSGGMVVSESHRGYVSRHFLFDDFDFDLRRITWSNTEANQPFREAHFSWNRDNGAYYVQRYATKERLSDNQQAPHSVRRLEVEFSHFEANVPLVSSLFTIGGVELPPGTPFLDHRENVNGKPKELTWNGQALVVSQE